MKTTERNTMRKSLYLVKAMLLAILAIAFNQSCTNLDEELYGEVTPENFFKTEEEIVAALGAAYTQFGGYASGTSLNLQEITTDEMVVPTRGSDWDDGGDWRRLHLHAWTREDGNMNGGWNFGFGGVNTANRLIYQFEVLVDDGAMEPDVAAAYIAELRAIRGFFYWQLIDMYGNVPLVTDFANAEALPPTVPRADVYDWLVADLEEAVPLLSKAVDGTTYGRMNYWAGKTLLAKLYLNAEVYTGVAAWDKCEAACTDIIDNGGFSLTGNYFDNFSAANTGTSEMIFAIPYDQVYYTGFSIAVESLHYASQYTYNLTAQPWNGYCSLEEFYNSYEDIDVRKGDAGTTEGPAIKRGNFIAGYQYNADGSQTLDDGADATDPDGKWVNFGNIGTGEPQINELGPQAWRQSGVRIGKWEIELGAHPDAMNNDYAVFRLADVILMKAEALWRQSGSATDGAALLLVNDIRGRAGVDDLTTLDGPVSFDMGGPSIPGGELLNEIGRELAFENFKRQTLIRWGLYNDVAKWALPYNNPGDVLVDGEHTTLFPVHRDKLEANPNLVQNPGYN
jgi:starch-binding outer membrane protein, SusD/RagB family